jgi:hypothetical protein
MLADLQTWSDTSSSDRTGISGVADRLSKSTGIDLNPIGEQARMLAEQERGLTWGEGSGDSFDRASDLADSLGFEDRSSDNQDYGGGSGNATQSDDASFGGVEGGWD